MNYYRGEAALHFMPFSGSLPVGASHLREEGINKNACLL